MRGLPVRGLVVLAALLASACGVDVKTNGHGGPYSVEIRQVGQTSVYVVKGPGDKVVAARAGGGESALLNADQLQHALAAMPTPKPTAEQQGGDHVSIHAPGFDLNVQGDDVHVNDGHTSTTHVSAGGAHVDVDSDDDNDHDADHSGNGHVSMNIGGFGMHVDADEGGPGHDDDRAQVTLSGMSAHDVRHFIREQDDLSSDVQNQMIAALNLPADAAGDDDGDDNDDNHHLAGGPDDKGKKPNK
ncbi:MAG: hypothetical protein QM759_07910 [Terricaulis sp.]